MHTLFYPHTVAVIGVSAKPTNLGRNIVANLMDFGFTGIVYAVGPRGGAIATRPIYPSVLDIPDQVDLAIILTPARTLPGILDECGKKGVRWAVVETAGLGEYSEEGQKIETEMMRVAKQYGIRIVGPNCIGIINMENGLCSPFARLTPFKLGNVSLISQSGGLGISVLNSMTHEGVGINKFISAGNMLDADAQELLKALAKDKGTHIIFLHIEGIRDGRRLMQVARDSEKPILALKANIGRLGKNIAASHTASLSSDDKVVDAAFGQCGIIRIHDATSLIHTVQVLQLPLLKGKNLAILSRSGGHAIVAADACEHAGFNLAPFPQEFIQSIEERLRASVIKLTNPLDLGDLFDLDLYAEILERILKQPWADGIVFLYTSVSESERDKTRQLIQRMDKLSHAYDKPIAFYLSTARQEVEYAKQNYDLPIFTQVVETIRALKHSYEHYQNLQMRHNHTNPPRIAVNRAAVEVLIQKATAQGRNLLLHEALQVLDHYGIPIVQSIRATTAQEVEAAAARIDAPVAIKVIAGQLSHKSDVGGVQLDLEDPAAATQAFRVMTERIHHAHPDAHVDGVLVQPMITDGHELILGGRQDAQFGPVVLVGMGGIFVEILDQVSVRVAPISQREALAMLEKLQGASILMGARGHKRADIPATVDALLRVSQLLCDFPAIQELDINPLHVLSESKGCQALDARIILQH